MKVKTEPIIVGAFGTVLEKSDKGFGRTENPKKSRSHPD